MTDPAALNAQHRIPGQLEFKEAPGGLTVAEVANGQGTATIALQGAQIMTWAPRNMEPVIYRSAEHAPVVEASDEGAVNDEFAGSAQA